MPKIKVRYDVEQEPREIEVSEEAYEYFRKVKAQEFPQEYPQELLKSSVEEVKKILSSLHPDKHIEIVGTDEVRTM